MATRKKCVYRAYSKVNLPLDAIPGMSRRRWATDAVACRALQQHALIIHRFSKGIDNMPEPALIGINQRIRVDELRLRNQAQHLQVTQKASQAHDHP